LDAASQAQLERGRRVVEVLKQPQYQPVPVAEQVVAIYAVTSGLMDDVPVARVAAFELGLREWFRTRHAGLLRVIADTGELPPVAELNEAIADFKLTQGEG
jgi:F-type H+-transporting ATPase subunit alpha